MAAALIISFVEWAGAFQRPQHMALGLARRGWEVTYLCPRYLHRNAQQVSSGLELPATLRVARPAVLPGGSRSALLAAINDGLMRRAVGSLRRKHWDAVIFNDPRWGRLARGLAAETRVFDCMDDLSAQAPGAAWAERREREALACADRVWTGTGTLADRLEGRHPQVRFIPGGVDAERFAQPDPTLAERVERELPAGDGPLAGYFGVINERFDGARAVALLESGWRVLLIGPGSSRSPRLPEHPRLRWIGPRPYAELPSYLARFDLGVIPYDTQGPHRFLYPVKALEYLAGGKPVLSTPLPDVVRFLGEYVELADTVEDWREAGARLAVDRAEAGARARAGQCYARTRSWEAMVDEMERELDAGVQAGIK